MTNCAIIIPARMASTRLPGKPLADIGGKPMIAHMLDIARRSGLGPAFVAAGDDDIMAALPQESVVKTNPDLPSGTDRVAEALTSCAPQAEIIVNLQGDVPLLAPSALQSCVDALLAEDADMATLVVPLPAQDIANDPSSVKAVVAWNSERHGRALYFSRAAVPHGSDVLHYHVGIYAFRKEALRRFVQHPPHPLEEAEKLEQLRALGLGMKIAVGVCDEVPLGVDTPSDLEKARTLFRNKT